MGLKSLNENKQFSPPQFRSPNSKTRFGGYYLAGRVADIIASPVFQLFFFLYSFSQTEIFCDPTPNYQQSGLEVSKL